MHRYIWRFMTGLHMDGKRRQHHGKTTVMPQYRDYFWNRYTRWQRARWRISVVLGLLGFAILYFHHRGFAQFIGAAFLPFLGYWIWRKILATFTIIQPFTDHDGVRKEYRTLHHKWHRELQKVKPRRFAISLPDDGPVDPEVAKAILAENAESYGSPITSLRAIGENDVTDIPVTGRARSIARKAGKR
jgi:hypothetical protein